MIHIILYYNREKLYAYIHQKICMNFKLPLDFNVKFKVQLIVK